MLQSTNISFVSFVYLKGVVAPIIHAKCAKLVDKKMILFSCPSVRFSDKKRNENKLFNRKLKNVLGRKDSNHIEISTKKPNIQNDLPLITKVKLACFYWKQQYLSMFVSSCLTTSPLHLKMELNKKSDWI